MLLDFAPMEGITGAAFRQLHHRYFPGVDRYYAPFLSPTRDHRFTPREQRELFPEHNRGLCVIPQVLTRVPEDFLWAARSLCELGYGEINLNLGCPSGTVTAKGKGAGMLASPDGLDRFLEAIFRDTPCPISVKTRLGLEAPEEFDALLPVFDRYPIRELIIHPRVRKDFYRHPVRTGAFEAALARSKNPVSFNGGIVTAGDCRRVMQRYPDIRAVMVGQGLVSDPFLAGRLRRDAHSDRETLRRFHDELLDAYASQFGSRRNATSRMKELWLYLILLFGDSDRWGKQLRKSRTTEEYDQTVRAIFQELPLLEQSRGGW